MEEQHPLDVGAQLVQVGPGLVEAFPGMHVGVAVPPQVVQGLLARLPLFFAIYEGGAADHLVVAIVGPAVR